MSDINKVSEIKKISDDFSAGGQPTVEDLEHLAEQGYKSVINLRSEGEAGALDDEQQQAEAAGLHYTNIPLKSTESSNDVRAKVLSEVEALPTPIYFHCGAGGRASALALIALATQQKLTRDQVLAKAEELNLSPEQPHLQQFLESL